MDIYSNRKLKSNFYSLHIPDEPSRTGDIAIYVLTFVEKNGIDNSSTHPLPSPLVLCVCIEDMTNSSMSKLGI